MSSAEESSVLLSFIRQDTELPEIARGDLPGLAPFLVKYEAVMRLDENRELLQELSKFAEYVRRMRLVHRMDYQEYVGFIGDRARAIALGSGMLLPEDFTPTIQGLWEEFQAGKNRASR